MSETSETSETGEASEAREAPEAVARPAVTAPVAPGRVVAGPDVPEPAAAEPVTGARRRGRLVAVAGSALLACAVVGGAGYTVVTVQDADRAPGRPTWEPPATPAEGGPEAGAGAARRGLSALMLPFGTDGYQRGPDRAEFGSDAELSGAQAMALRKEAVKDMPSASRRKLEKLIDKDHVKGMAMRSYTAVRPDEAEGEPTRFVFDVTLSRLESRTAVRRSVTNFNGFVAAVDVFRKGPKIEGHPDARCFLSPKGKKKHVAAALCTAAVGDVLVSVSAAAPDPVDGAFVAKFFAAQLDRIDDPGQAV